MPNISLTKLCKEHGIQVLTYDAANLPQKALDIFHIKPECRGVSIMMDGKPSILVDMSLPLDELRYTVAHELGHILLGHLSFRDAHGTELPQAEMEANAFAAALIVQDLIYSYGQKEAAVHE